MANIMTSDGSPGKDEQQCLVYPNPIFTACIFEVPVDGNGNARIEIYDAMGTLRSLMQKEYRESGTMQFTWDARDASGTRLPAGYYMYRIISGEQIFTGKILINR